MKQTAVEWLTEELRNQFGIAFSNNILEKAKEMERKQIINFAYWLTDSKNIKTKDASIEELLEIYKKV